MTCRIVVLEGQRLGEWLSEGDELGELFPPGGLFRFLDVAIKVIDALHGTFEGSCQKKSGLSRPARHNENGCRLVEFVFRYNLSRAFGVVV
jgi:hypothetical protein